MADLRSSQSYKTMCISYANLDVVREGYMCGFGHTARAIEDKGELNDRLGGVSNIGHMRIEGWPFSDVIVKEATSASAMMVLNHVENPRLKLHGCKLLLHEIRLETISGDRTMSLLELSMKGLLDSRFLMICAGIDTLDRVIIEKRSCGELLTDMLSQAVHLIKTGVITDAFVEIEFSVEQPDLCKISFLRDGNVKRNFYVDRGQFLDMIGVSNTIFWKDAVILDYDYVNNFAEYVDVQYNVPSHIFLKPK